MQQKDTFQNKEIQTFMLLSIFITVKARSFPFYFNGYFSLLPLPHLPVPANAALFCPYQQSMNCENSVNIFKALPNLSFPFSGIIYYSAPSLLITHFQIIYYQLHKSKLVLGVRTEKASG
jgi:hypothetical protein